MAAVRVAMADLERPLSGERHFFVALHFVLREKPKISWEFEKEGTPISLEATWNEGNHVFLVGGLGFGGENISGHALHQVDGEITPLRDRRTLPVFVAIEGSMDGS
jgi:hypothetical protein